MRGALLLLVLVVSGCADPAEPSDAPSSKTESSTPVPFLFPEESRQATASTLYLVADPAVSLVAPGPGEPLELDLTATGPGLQGFDHEPLHWSYVLQTAARIESVAVSVWIRVDEPIVTQPEDSFLRAWVLGVQVGDDAYYANSGPYDAVLPGDHELNATITFPSRLDLPSGDTIGLIVDTSAVAPASQRVFVLVGSADFPSRFAFDRLREPVPGLDGA